MRMSKCIFVCAMRVISMFSLTTNAKRKLPVSETVTPTLRCLLTAKAFNDSTDQHNHHRLANAYDSVFLYDSETSNVTPLNYRPMTNSPVIESDVNKDFDNHQYQTNISNEPVDSARNNNTTCDA